MKKVLACCVVSAVILAAAASEVLYISHRGESKDAPQNTMAAFRLAWERQTDGVECDVRLSSDGRVVVIHDEDTKGVADENLPVAGTDVDKLRKLDVGRKKNERFMGEKIPLLSEVLAALPEQGLLFIELKSGERQLPGKVRDLVQAAGCTPEQIRFISFNAGLLAEMKRLMPAYRCYYLRGLSYDPEQKEVRQDLDAIAETALRIKADGVSLSYGSFWTEELVKKFKDKGLEVHCWTVNSPAAAKRARSLGVGSITSDCARLLMDRWED